MIARIWHGWTTLENADTYEELLKNEIFPSIENKKVKGYRKISLLKRVLKYEVEFMTVMLFDDLEAVKAFAGENYQKAYVPIKARKVLLRHDENSQHYEIMGEIYYE
jgi:heme-degrading monooxygenase HmoA